MKSVKRILTTFGKTCLLASIIVTVIAILAGPLVMSATQKTPYTPVTLQECAPHEGIIFNEDAIVVNKRIAFCHPIKEMEHIPPSTIITAGNIIISPASEDASTAVFSTTLRALRGKEWHVVAQK